MNKDLATHKSVQTLENLASLSMEEREELRLHFVKKTGIQQKTECGDCVKVWAKLYRNTYNSMPKEPIEPKVDVKKEVAEPKVKEDGKSKESKDKR